MQDLNVTLIQSSLHWQDPAQNRAHFAELIAQLSTATDLIILPEMFSSGFTMAPEQVAESMQGETHQWLLEQARLSGAAICGSVVIETTGGFCNRLLFVTPEGETHHYDKRHLFRMGKEHQHYQAGQSREIVHYKGWRIMPLICYDLRFPVWSRNSNDYDLLIYVANWPQPRRHAWRTLLQARAIENQAYCIGVNRVGSDGNQLNYSGDSLLSDYLGELIIDQPQGQAFVASTTLSAEKLQQFREGFPAWQDADTFFLAQEPEHD